MKEFNALKLLSFLFVFIVVVFLIIFILIVPDIKKLKEAKYKNRQVESIFQYTNNNLQNKIKELKDLKLNNLKIIRAFDSSFREKDFLNYSKKFFIFVKLTKDKNKKSDGNFTQYDFHTVSKISNPTVFYKFLTDINRYDNIIQVDFPISMKAVGNDINTTFKLKVFTLKGR